MRFVLLGGLAILAVDVGTPLGLAVALLYVLPLVLLRGLGATTYFRVAGVYSLFVGVGMYFALASRPCLTGWWRSTGYSPLLLSGCALPCSRNGIATDMQLHVCRPGCWKGRKRTTDGWRWTSMTRWVKFQRV